MAQNNEEVKATLLEGNTRFSSAATVMGNVKTELETLLANLNWLGPSDKSAKDAYMQVHTQFVTDAGMAQDILQKCAGALKSLHDAIVEAEEKAKQAEEQQDTEEVVILGVLIFAQAAVGLVTAMLIAADEASAATLEIIETEAMQLPDVLQDVEAVNALPAVDDVTTLPVNDIPPPDAPPTVNTSPAEAPPVDTPEVSPPNTPAEDPPSTPAGNPPSTLPETPPETPEENPVAGKDTPGVGQNKPINVAQKPENLPMNEPATNTVIPKDDDPVIFIDENGDVFVNHHPIAPDKLPGDLYGVESHEPLTIDNYAGPSPIDNAPTIPEEEPALPKIDKGKGVDKGSGPTNDSNGAGPSGSINSDSSVTTTETTVKPGFRGNTTTVKETTTYPDGSTKVTAHFYDVNNKPMGSSTKTIEGNVTKVTNYDVDGQPTHESITTTEGNTTTTIQLDGSGDQIGKSVEVTDADTTLSTDYNGKNVLSYQQKITNVYDENGNLVEIKQVIIERTGDGSYTQTTEVFSIDRTGGRYLDDSHTETIPNPNASVPSGQAEPTSSKSVFVKVKDLFRKK